MDILDDMGVSKSSAKVHLVTHTCMYSYLLYSHHTLTHVWTWPVLFNLQSIAYTSTHKHTHTHTHWWTAM